MDIGDGEWITGLGTPFPISHPPISHYLFKTIALLNYCLTASKFLQYWSKKRGER